MLDLVAKHGTRFKPPSYHEIRWNIWSNNFWKNI